MQAAAAPWAALGGVGAEVQALGEKAAAFMVRQQRVKNIRMANELELKANEDFAAFQNEMARNPNPDAWPEMWAKRLEGLKAAHLPSNLAPEQQALLGERMANFASQSTIDVAKSATMQGIGQAKQAIDNRLGQAVRMNDAEGGARAIQDGLDGGLFSDPEAEALSMDFNQKMEVQTVESDFQVDPIGTSKRLDEKNPDGTWANFTNLDPNQRARLIDGAKQQKRAVMGEAVDDAQNGFADGTITTPEQLERRVGGVVEPRVMEKLKSELAGRWDEKEIARRATPEYQNETVGKVTAMLADFTAEADDYDEKYVEMDSLARSLPEGSAAKSELTRRLGQVRGGQFQVIDNTADMARKNFEDAYKDKVFGETTKKQSVESALKDGLLKDAAKLRAIGLSPDQAKEIADEKDVPAQVVKFRELYQKRQGFDTADSYTRAALLAVVSGKEGVIELADPDAEKRAQRILGEAKTKFEQWLKANPDKATDDEAVTKKAYEILSPLGAKNVSRTIVPPRPRLMPPPDMDPDYPLLPIRPAR